jgi:hypothetical protein
LPQRVQAVRLPAAAKRLPAVLLPVAVWQLQAGLPLGPGSPVLPGLPHQ